MHLSAPCEPDLDTLTDQWRNTASAPTQQETADGNYESPCSRHPSPSARGPQRPMGCDVAMKQGDDEVSCDDAPASAAIRAADDQIRLIGGQALSASGIGESREVSATIAEQSPRVVAGEVSRPVVQADDTRRPRDAKRSVPKWEFSARERVRTAIRELHKPLNNLVARDANEADTRLLVTEFLCAGLGFDRYEDLTGEFLVKGEFADYGIRIDKELIAFVEIKRCTQKLGVRQLRQVQMYAVNEGVEWMILTNGQVWQVWHLTGGLPVVVDLALEVDLLSDATAVQKSDTLFHLSKESIKRKLLDELWRAKAATSPNSLANVMLSDAVIEALRKELRKQTGYKGDLSELKRTVREEVVRSELV